MACTRIRPSMSGVKGSVTTCVTVAFFATVWSQCREHADKERSKSPRQGSSETPPRHARAGELATSTRVFPRFSRPEVGGGRQVRSLLGGPRLTLKSHEQRELRARRCTSVRASGSHFGAGADVGGGAATGLAEHTAPAAQGAHAPLFLRRTSERTAETSPTSPGRLQRVQATLVAKPRNCQRRDAPSHRQVCAASPMAPAEAPDCIMPTAPTGGCNIGLLCGGVGGVLRGGAARATSHHVAMCRGGVLTALHLRSQERSDGEPPHHGSRQGFRLPRHTRGADEAFTKRGGRADSHEKKVLPSSSKGQCPTFREGLGVGSVERPRRGRSRGLRGAAHTAERLALEARSWTNFGATGAMSCADSDVEGARPADRLKIACLAETRAAPVATTRIQSSTSSSQRPSRRTLGCSKTTLKPTCSSAPTDSAPPRPLTGDRWAATGWPPREVPRSRPHWGPHAWQHNGSGTEKHSEYRSGMQPPNHQKASTSSAPPLITTCAEMHSTPSAPMGSPAATIQQRRNAKAMRMTTVLRRKLGPAGPLLHLHLHARHRPGHRHVSLRR